MYGVIWTIEGWEVVMIRPAEFANYPEALANLAPFGPFRAVVAEWHDGDTGYFMIDLGFTVYGFVDIRVQGCNAPELATQAGKDALRYVNENWPPGTPVVLDVERDFIQSFIRYVAQVILPDGNDLAKVLIAAGHAVPESKIFRS